MRYAALESTGSTTSAPSTGRRSNTTRSSGSAANRQNGTSSCPGPYL